MNIIIINKCLNQLAILNSSGETLSYATSNSQDGARLDIAANGFWGGRYERTFFDVRVFNPMQAPTDRRA